MTPEKLRSENLVIFECISGSKAQGLATTESDTDIRGVFILPREIFYGFDYIPQVNNETNDIVFYELKRFMELLSRNNPNILEMLGVDEEFIITKHPLFDMIKPESFISKLCKQTFAGYAMSQIKRARGLNKKIVNPLDKKKKSLLDFSYIITGPESIPVQDWLKQNSYSPNDCGLVSIPHIEQGYALFHAKDNPHHFNGLLKKDNSEMLALSSVPKGLAPEATLFCNINGYSAYCKDYHAYWDWVNKRNESRYQNTIQHGKNYDAKNLMHTFRLLNMAQEILESGIIQVRRPDRETLLRIRNGEYEYDELISMAEKKIGEIEKAYAVSKLPDNPDRPKAEALLTEIRCRFYESC